MKETTWTLFKGNHFLTKEKEVRVRFETPARHDKDYQRFRDELYAYARKNYLRLY